MASAARGPYYPIAPCEKIREVINTILYLNGTGCKREMLPHDLLPKSTVCEYLGQFSMPNRCLNSINAEEIFG